MENLLVPSHAETVIPATRVLVLAPHPDDEVFGCGGAIVRHVAAGATVHVIIWTDGAWGAKPEDRAACIAQRQGESNAAARVLGYGQPEFRSREDRALLYGEDLVHEILAAVDASGAELVYAPSVLEMHPDHRALALAAIEAVRRRGSALRIALYEVGIPLRPNTLLDITDIAGRKLEAMQCFVSQLARQRYDLDVSALNRFRSYTLPAHVTAAEAYVVVSGDELMHDPLGLHQSEYSRQRALGLPLDSKDYPLVSVIVRSMDRAPLALTLDSIALQTYPNIEVVLVNAKGSPHRDMGEWCGRFPLRLIEPGKQLDRPVAANCGLDAARGELLIFLDDDDLFLPHHITRLQQELAGNEQLIAAYAGVQCTDIDGTELRRFADEFDLLKLSIGNFMPIHAVMFRRTALAKGARFDETLPVCEDWDFWLQLEQLGRFKLIPETGAIYRVHLDAGSGVWTDQGRNREIILRIYRRRMPGWSDNILWGVFEFARYKPMYDELLGMYQGLQQQLADQRAETAQHAEAAANLGHQCADYQARLQHMHEALMAKNAVLSEAWAREEQLATGVRERDERLAQLYASTSWRITQPLRRLRTLGGGSPPQYMPPTPEAAAPEPVQVQTPEPVQVQAPVEPAQQYAPLTPLPEAPLAPASNPYTYEVNLSEPSAAVFVMELTGKNKRVLEVGCGPGSITKILNKVAGCRVTGLELDEQAIEHARPWCEAIHRADLNDKNWPQVLGGAKGFQTAIAADVLEHVYDPWSVLRQMASLVALDGSIVVSLPHAGHAVISACLFNGDVHYSQSGLLDRTHIRFFGMKNIEDLFAQAHLKIVAVRHVLRRPDETELAEHWRKLPESVREALRLNKHCDVYQVVVKAVHVDQPGAAVSLL